MPILTKEEFIAELISNADQLYESYARVETQRIEKDKAQKTLDDIFAKANKPSDYNNLHLDSPIYSEAEVSDNIKKLQEYSAYERLLLTVGKTAIKVAISSL